MVQFKEGDYYFIDNYIFILLNGFYDKDMKLPFYVSNWLFAIEVTRQEDYAEIMWGVPKGKKILYTYPLGFDSIQNLYINCWDYLTKIQKIAVISNYHFLAI